MTCPGLSRIVRDISGASPDTAGIIPDTLPCRMYAVRYRAACMCQPSRTHAPAVPHVCGISTSQVSFIGSPTFLSFTPAKGKNKVFFQR